MLTPLLLAATIAGSIPSAVERTLRNPPSSHFGEEEPCQLGPEDPATIAARLAELEARVVRNEKIRDDTTSCISESLIGTGADQGFTALARDRCPECGEANPGGFNAEARTALKFAQTGAEVALCLLAAKHAASDPTSNHRHGKWIARGLRLAFVLNGAYTSITGKPLVRWGIGSREALEK